MDGTRLRLPTRPGRHARRVVGLLLVAGVAGVSAFVLVQGGPPDRPDVVVPEALIAPRQPEAVPDACGLVLLADAAALFHAEAEQTAPLESVEAPGEGSTCVYRSEGTPLQVLVVRVSPDPGTYAQELYDDAESLTGLGDRAFVSRGEAAGGPTVQFQDGGVVCTLSYSRFDAADPAAADLDSVALEQLARETARRVEQGTTSSSRPG